MELTKIKEGFNNVWERFVDKNSVRLNNDSLGENVAVEQVVDILANLVDSDSSTHKNLSFQVKDSLINVQYFPKSDGYYDDYGTCLRLSVTPFDSSLSEFIKTYHSLLILLFEGKTQVFFDFRMNEHAVKKQNELSQMQITPETIGVVTEILNHHAWKRLTITDVEKSARLNAFNELTKYFNQAPDIILGYVDVAEMLYWQN